MGKLHNCGGLTCAIALEIQLRDRSAMLIKKVILNFDESS